MRIGGILVALVAVSLWETISAQELYSSRSCEFNNARALATRMVCRHVTSEQDLHKELKPVRRFSQIEELVLESSSFRFLKHDSFLGTNFKAITLTGNSILELTDTQEAFVGLEDTLEKLVIEDSSFVSHWDWSHLKNLRKLSSLVVRGSDLVYLPDTLRNVSANSLERLQFPYNDVAWIHDGAFSSFRKMTYLMLEYNEITGLRRSMFPGLPNKLQTLNLRHNFIKTLPEDIFTDMPNLKSVVLDENMLTTIDERVFGAIWGQLLLLQMNDGALICDCRLKWMGEREQRPRLVYSMCDKPAKLKGRLLSSLRNELEC